LLAIYLLNQKKYSGSITYIEDISIGLFDSLVNNFPEIYITYNGESINHQLTLIKGYLVNNGSIDISPSLVEQSLSINLPDTYKWLSVKVVRRSEGNKSTLKIIEKNKIVVDLALFRKNEFITFEALAEVPIDVGYGFDVSKNINFQHRIANTSQVKRTYLKFGYRKNESADRLNPIIVGILSSIYFIIILTSKKYLDAESTWPFKLKMRPIPTFLIPQFITGVWLAFIFTSLFLLNRVLSFVKFKKEQDLKKLLGI